MHLLKVKHGFKSFDGSGPKKREKVKDSLADIYKKSDNVQGPDLMGREFNCCQI